MTAFDWIVVLLLASVALTAFARRIGVPYPTMLALAGAGIAFVPNGPRIAVEPDIMLAIFVAPVLLDAAFDSSVRDLRENWLPITGLVLVAVGTTTAAVAWIARTWVPDMPWAAAIALGAIVAPPDAAAATAVLRQVNPPHRVMVILEGESLLNDASALFVYRLAVSAMAAGGSLGAAKLAITFLFVVPGSLLMGVCVALVVGRVLIRSINDAPSSIVLQFSMCFATWLLADRLGLSPILTVVAQAITAARTAGGMPARLRVPSYAVWEAAVYVLNVLAFVLIGLQLAPIIEHTEAARLEQCLWVAGWVLATVILVRFAWVMSYNSVVRLKNRVFGVVLPRPMMKPTFWGGIIIGWSGMRGIVTLAAALALPESFPHRDLILVCAAIVVLGTLLIQGITLQPLVRLAKIDDNDPVGQETGRARVAAYQAMIAEIEGDDGRVAILLRKEYHAVLKANGADGSAAPTQTAKDTLRLRSIAAARTRLFDMRRNREIGDTAFHRIEEELDRAEVHASGG